MLTVINNTLMQHIVTTLGIDMPIALAWAETIPYQNDFSILTHVPSQFAPYTDNELYTLYCSLESPRGVPTASSREDFMNKLINELNMQEITSEPPPDVKRVAPIETNSEINTMTTSKKTVSKKVPAKKAPDVTKPATKPPVKKTPEKRTVKNAARAADHAIVKKTPAKKKAVAKKPAVKKAPAEKRERKNGMLLPRPDSAGGKVWAIADKLSKKAGAPAARKDVMNALPDDISIGCAGGYFQDWRRFHGLVKKVIADTKLKMNTSTK